MAYDYDLFVIGGGSGGVRAARIAAETGARVGLAEEYRMGGTCVIRGCVPKKLMVYASAYPKTFKEARAYGWSFDEPVYDHAKAMSAIADQVSYLSGLYMKGQKAAGVTVFEERAEFLNPHSLLLRKTGQTITAEKILIAVGGAPYIPTPSDMPGVEKTITSNEIFQMRTLPRHILIAGGGYIAVEFAHILNGLGAQTTLVYRKDKVLRGFDEDVRTYVQEGLSEAGINFIGHNIIDKIEQSGEAELPLRVHLSQGETLNVSDVMLAIGRRPNTAGLNCDKAGIELDAAGAIKVDAYSRTNVENIWAVGDVTNRVQLTPVAIREGHAFADTEFGGTPHTFDHSDIATAVFTQPEVGTVGLTESEARETYGEVDIYQSRFRPLKNLVSGSEERAFIKLIVRASDQRVLGVHIISPHAAEMIQLAGVAVKMGATKQDFDRTCAVHPSIAEELVTMRHKVR